MSSITLRPDIIGFGVFIVFFNIFDFISVKKLKKDFVVLDPIELVIVNDDYVGWNNSTKRKSFCKCKIKF